MVNARIVTRPVMDDTDIGVWLSIHNAVVPSRDWSVHDLCSLLQAADSHLHLLTLDGSRPVAAALGVALVSGVAPGIAPVWVSVEAGSRCHGIGTDLYQSLERWAANQGKTGLEAAIEEEDEASRHFANRRGYVDFRRETRLSLDLAGIDAPAVVPPPGIDIVTLASRPELSTGMYHAALDGFFPADQSLPSFHSWAERYLHRSGDPPEACFIAVASQEVVGYAKLHFSDARPRVASHAGTCLRKAWRGRGIARALKCAQINWAAAAGCARMEASNDPSNQAKFRLYTSLGYREIPGRVITRHYISPR